ncbi:hypothetical protein [Falsiroseomonas sp.]|uniref:phage head spike fiber domain-containing protein n=1 Tax=Falsiroseomonas sp. TaxID=2870721 RepID=UPI003565B56F
MSTSAIPTLLGLHGAARRSLVAPGAIYAPLSLARAQVSSRATALGPDEASVQIFAADTPRFRGATRRLLREAQRTNEIADPLDFTAASWSVLSGGSGSAPVITPAFGGIPAPDGSFTATRLQLDKGAGTLSTDRSGLSRTTSLNAARFVWARTLSGTANVQIGTSSVTPAVQSVVDTTWRRFGNVDGGGVHRVMLLGGGSGNSDSADLLVWGASSEAGAPFPSSLILPPAGSPQSSTRGAELLSAALADLGIGEHGACTILWSGLFPNQTAGYVALLLQVDSGSNATRWYIDSRATDGLLRLLNSAGGLTNLSPHTAGIPFRLGLALDGTGRGAASMNGAAAAVQTGGPAAGLTTLRLGTTASGGNAAFAETTVLQVLPFALSDSALEAAVAALPA